MRVSELLSEIDPVIIDPNSQNMSLVEFDPSPQDQIPRIRGSPEGLLAMRCGQLIVDFETGKLYQKRSRIELATGWVELGLVGGGGVGGGLTVGSGPPGVQASGTMYWDEDTKMFYVFDSEGPNIH